MEEAGKIRAIGIYLILFLLSLIVIPVWAYYNVPDQLIRTLTFIGAAGGLGGTVYCMRGFYKTLVDEEKKFDLKWTWWYLYRPLFSIVIGEIVYFLIVGGLLSIGNVSEVNYSKSVMFYCALAFLGGFSFTRFANKLDELAATIFAVKNEDKK